MFCGLYVPSPVTVALALSVAVAVITTSVSSAAAVYVYVVVFGLNALSKLPTGSDVTLRALNVASLFSFVMFTVYVFWVVPSWAVTVMSKLFSPTCKFLLPSPLTAASLSSGVAVILIESFPALALAKV